MGVNVVTPFEVSPFIFQNLIGYKGIPFNRYTPDKNGFCLGVFCKMSQYTVKVYDKGTQNNLAYYLKRFEKKFFKMQQLEKSGIKCLADLQDRERVKGLLIHLTEAWQNILIYDIEPETLAKLKKEVSLIHSSSQDTTKMEFSETIKESDFDLLNKGDNPKFWENLKKSNKRRFNYQRDKFRELVKKYGSD